MLYINLGHIMSDTCRFQQQILKMSLNMKSLMNENIVPKLCLPCLQPHGTNHVEFC